MAESDQHVDNNETDQKVNKKLNANRIDTIIFQTFNNLINENSAVRIKSAATLLQKIKNDSGEKAEFQLNYVLKRLIRGTGAATSASRNGFYTTLVGYFKTVPNVDVAEVYEILNKELNVGSAGEPDKVDSHANTGRILVCGALIHSGILFESSFEHLKTCIDILVKASKVKSFHTSLAYSFLIEFIRKCSKHQFKLILWPQIVVELQRPWAKQNLDTVNFLIVLEETYPGITSKFISKFLDTPTILSKTSAFPLSQLLWKEVNNGSLVHVNHPVYDSLSKKEANSEFLVEFWTGPVDKKIGKINNNKIVEIISVKFLTNIFANTNHALSTTIQLLTANFMKMMVQRYKSLVNKTKSHDNFILDFYGHFLDAVWAYIEKRPNDDGKLELIKIFMLHPGYLMIDKLTSKNIISNLISLLDADEIKELTEIYKSIAINTAQKNEHDESEAWLNTERIYALQMVNKLLGNAKMLKELEWRKEQLLFLMNLTIFKTKDGYKLLKNDKLEDCVVSLQDSNLKSQFYHSLENKFPNLYDEYTVLLSLIENYNKHRSSNKMTKIHLSEEGVKGWDSMYKEISEKKLKSTNNFEIVFRILLLHMGLQLFNDETLAISAIEELRSCIKRVNKTAKSVANDDEPEWIEVVVDLILHLLSQNSSLLRNLINKVFPKLCPNLTLSAIHQILSVLDMSDDKNPLLDNADDDSDQEMGDEEEEEVDDEDNESDAEDNSDEDHENNESENDEKDDDDDFDEEGTVTDQLRSAVTQALGSSGFETDQESIDLNDMDDADAKKLDSALAQAFKMYSENRTKNKKTKKERLIDTTTLHFRSRVLDLLEIYVKSADPNLYFILDMMNPIFFMINFCVKENEPLLNKVRSILNKITTLKKFAADSLDEVTDEYIIKVLKDLVNMKFNSNSIGDKNTYVSKCSIFLLKCSEIVARNDKTSSNLIETFKEYLLDFIEHRNPKLPLSIFNQIFQQTNWPGIWNLADVLIDSLKTKKMQSIRRVQILNLFRKLYTNHRFLSLNPEKTKTNIKKFEQDLTGFISQYADNVTPKLFGEILELLLEISKFHRKFTNFNSNTMIDWDALKVQLEKIRGSLVLETMNHNIYRKFCNVMHMKYVKNATEHGLVPASKLAVPKTNGHNHHNNDTSDVDTDHDDEDDDSKPIDKKRKRLTGENKIDTRKSKKLKKEERLKLSSAGLENEGIEFTGLGVEVEEGPAVKPKKFKFKKKPKPSGTVNGN